MKIGVLFPGQGSQYIGMAQEFITQNTSCSALMGMAEAACELPLGTVCADGPMEVLIRGAHLQPSITITNMICWQAFVEAAGDDLEVSYFAGHSLGEYSALYAAGVISAEDTIRLVAKRGALMQREGDKNPGGMRAVLGLKIDDVEDIITQCNGFVVTAANHNTPEQVVISGAIDGLDFASKLASEKGAKVIPLNVSVANHSPLVAGAVEDFANFMSDIEFSSPKIPVLFNVTAEAERDPLKMKQMMASQIATKVRWCETIQKMVDDGVDTFIEVGPKAVLKGMVKKIVPKGMSINSYQFDNPATLAACLDKLRAN